MYSENLKILCPFYCDVTNQKVTVLLVHAEMYNVTNRQVTVLLVHTEMYINIQLLYTVAHLMLLIY